MGFKTFFSLILLFLPTCCIAKDLQGPWGKDADLIKCNKKAGQLSKFTCGSETIIRFHQGVLSEADGPRSHFKPSSSQYMLDAICKYGLFVGFSYGCDRLLRENSDPWIYEIYLTRDKDILKWDPVP